MAGPRLTEAPPRPSRTTPPQVEPSKSGPRLLTGDHAPERATIYWILVLVLLGGAVLLRASPWSTGIVLHTIMETIATALAFIIGVVPLVIGQGAGAEMRRTLGTAVFAGMLGVTLFGIFLTPVFFYVIQGLADWRASRIAARGDG